MPKITKGLSLPELQAYQAALCQERGWDQASDLETFLLFTEEVGELAKAIRNRKELFVESGKVLNSNELASEFSDVFSYLIELANKFEVDLESAFIEKERKNEQREWG